MTADDVRCTPHPYESYVGCKSCRADALVMTDPTARAAALAEWNARLQARECDERFPVHYAGVLVDHPAVAAWVEAYSSGGKKSLVLLGETGVGKTHAAYAALRAAATGPRPATWIATTAADLYGTLRPRPKTDSEAELRRFRDRGLLFVDDLGATKHSEWVEEVTYRIIDFRYVNALPMIITTNIPTSELRGALGARIASRLNEMCSRVVLEGLDRRGRGRAS